MKTFKAIKAVMDYIYERIILNRHEKGWKKEDENGKGCEDERS